MRPELRHVESWIFDLDNSLYPASANLFALIDIRMGEFIQRLVGCDRTSAAHPEAAFPRARHHARGLMAAHDVDPTRIPGLCPRHRSCAHFRRSALVDAIERLPGRKFVFTNGDEAYATRVLEKLGLANLWDGLHDIHAMDYVPKPNPAAYAALCERWKIDPTAGLFVEDMAATWSPARSSE
jgi:putative hydrolase of the HAD superfamily